MNEHVHGVVLIALKSLVQKSQFVSISADEVMAVDNTSWIAVHVYVVEGWERIPHLLHFSCELDSSTADHLTSMIMHALMAEGGLTEFEIASKVVCFGTDGVSTFQRAKNGVTAQI